MPDYLYEPAGWGDADWWRMPTVMPTDVGEAHSEARRAAAVLRRRAYARECIDVLAIYPSGRHYTLLGEQEQGLPMGWAS